MCVCVCIFRKKGSPEIARDQAHVKTFVLTAAKLQCRWTSLKAPEICTKSMDRDYIKSENDDARGDGGGGVGVGPRVEKKGKDARELVDLCGSHLLLESGDRPVFPDMRSVHGQHNCSFGLSGR